MAHLVIALVVALTGADAWAQGGFVEGHAQGDGVRLYFMQAGAGPLIVFLHGHPDGWTLYDAQLRAFSSDYLAVAPNLRVVRVDDADHYPMRSHHRLVNQAIREFLRAGAK